MRVVDGAKLLGERGIIIIIGRIFRDCFRDIDEEAQVFLWVGCQAVDVN
jgi:hypothetical protein